MPLPMDRMPTSSSPTKAPLSASTLPPAAIALATRFFNAARTGDLALIHQAISAGLPVNLTNDKGDTLLMLASYHTQPALVRYLLQQHADPDALNERGQSVLAGAVFKAAGGPRVRSGGLDGDGVAEGEEEKSDADQIIEMLLEAGADVDRGRPSARESVEMFRVERWKGSICGVERG